MATSDMGKSSILAEREAALEATIRSSVAKLWFGWNGCWQRNNDLLATGNVVGGRRTGAGSCAACQQGPRWSG